ncbi:MAG: PP2C family serine/threonine-protein phosphatase [Candidatus Moraniibacteriota bacterium]
MKKEITFITKQGPRDYQEDRGLSVRIIAPTFTAWLLAVFDGHFGQMVSEFCSKKINELFKMTGVSRAESTLKKIVAQLDKETKNFEEGSTLSIALITERPKGMFSASIAILGDSPIIVFDKSGKIHVSPEHNVRTNLEEREAAKGRGGRYHPVGYIFARGYDNGIQLGRALGDTNFGKVLSHKPEIYTIPNPQWVLVATDGLFDPTHENSVELIGEIGKYAKQSANAEDLMAWAERRGLSDNATAIVWK